MAYKPIYTPSEDQPTLEANAEHVRHHLKGGNSGQDASAQTEAARIESRSRADGVMKT
jgi:hypothetical protein